MNDNRHRPSLRERNVARILLILPFLAWGSGYTEWHVFGDYDNQVTVLITFVALVALVRLGHVAERH